MNFISKVLRKYSKTQKATSKKCVFQTFNQLAQITQSINLGAGTPSSHPPDFITQAINKYSNQSSQKFKVTLEHNYRLNQKISQIYSNHHQEVLDPLNNIITTTGARQALASCLNVLLEQGDQAITFDPSYQTYRKSIQDVGATAVGVLLKPKFKQTKQMVKKKGPKFQSDSNDLWEIDFKKLAESVNEKTKLLLINSPHNPTGKIFTQEQLKEIGKIIEKFPRIVVIDDRVYQHSHYDSFLNKKVPKISTLPGFKNRTLSIYSGGKLLRVQNLRCGWIIGPKQVINQIKLIDPPQNLSNQLHYAISQSLQQIYQSNNPYLNDLTRTLIKSRSLLLQSLIQSKYNFNLWIPQGGYFVLADIQRIQLSQKYFYAAQQQQNKGCLKKITKDYAFCTKLCKEDGVSSIPCSGFFGKQNLKMGQNLIRFAFCKDQHMIVQAGKRMK